MGNVEEVCPMHVEDSMHSDNEQDMDMGLTKMINFGRGEVGSSIADVAMGKIEINVGKLKEIFEGPRKKKHA